MTPKARLGAAATAALAAVALLGGCGSAEREGAAAAASRFVQAVASDAAGACELLAPATRAELESDSEEKCPAALGRLDDLPDDTAAVFGHEPGVTVAGHSAQVVGGGQAIFLARFDTGWLVTAAGCTREESDPDHPYDCVVKGG